VSMASTNTPPSFDEYLTELHRHARRVLKRRGSRDADDVASIVVLSASTCGPKLMSRYSPSAYARIRAPHAQIEFDRRERTQRGEGGKLRHLDDGTVEAARPMKSFDELTKRDLTATGFTIDDGLFPFELYAVITDTVGADHATALFDVAVLDRTVAEVAANRGVRRETLSRQLSASRRALERVLLPDGGRAPV